MIKFWKYSINILESLNNTQVVERKKHEYFKKKKR